MLLQAVTQVQAMPFARNLPFPANGWKKQVSCTSTFINVEVQFGRLVITSE